MSTFRPISPSLNQPLSVSVMEFEESEPVNPLIKWVFAVHNNAFSATSENITNLKGLSETFPSRTFEALSPNKYSDLIAKIQAIFTSLWAPFFEQKRGFSAKNRLKKRIFCLFSIHFYMKNQGFCSILTHL